MTMRITLPRFGRPWPRPASATVTAACGPSGSRTPTAVQRCCWTQFATSFGDADRVVALDIFRSRETDTLGINTSDVVRNRCQTSTPSISRTIQEAVDYLLDRVRPDDVILTLGAGDGNLVAARVCWTP